MSFSVIAITVTYNRFNTLKSTIECLNNQKGKHVDKILIVDNGSSKHIIEKLIELEKKYPKVEILYLNENLGGAGGFQMGMKYVLDKYNPDWYWIMDDDAYPRENCLANLIDASQRLNNIGFLAPIIWGVSKKKYQLYHHKMLSKYKIKDLTKELNESNLVDVTEIEANAFVGPLFPKNVVHDLGIPNGGLFIYGDDTEYTYRVSRKYKGYLIKGAVIEHEDPPIKSNIAEPSVWWKEYYKYRNRIFFIREFSESTMKCLLAEIYFALYLLKEIIKTLLQSRYKGFKVIRIKLLLKSIFHGINGNYGKTLDPDKYMMLINSINKRTYD